MGTAVDGPEAPAPQQPRWVRPLVIVAAAVALLLIGATAGLLIGLPGASSTSSSPAANSVDVGFAQDMTVHHEQAVEMAAWARDHTTDVQVKQLAFDIETTQLQQIGQMQGWLALWGQPSAPVGRDYMTWMADSGHSMSGMASAGAARMPGMATDVDLRNLRAATGKDLDVLFLQLMLRHHVGGADMLQYAADRASEPVVRNLAAQALSAQTSEAGLMRTMLGDRGAQPLPQN
ncbi:DUF305 domain-containing protein [Pseudonocardia ailaonensis]